MKRDVYFVQTPDGWDLRHTGGHVVGRVVCHDQPSHRFEAQDITRGQVTQAENAFLTPMAAANTLLAWLGADFGTEACPLPLGPWAEERVGGRPRSRSGVLWVVPADAKRWIVKHCGRQIGGSHRNRRKAMLAADQWASVNGYIADADDMQEPSEAECEPTTPRRAGDVLGLIIATQHGYTLDFDAKAPAPALPPGSLMTTHVMQLTDLRFHHHEQIQATGIFTRPGGGFSLECPFSTVPPVDETVRRLATRFRIVLVPEEDDGP